MVDIEKLLPSLFSLQPRVNAERAFAGTLTDFLAGGPDKKFALEARDGSQERLVGGFHLEDDLSRVFRDVRWLTHDGHALGQAQ